MTRHLRRGSFRLAALLALGLLAGCASGSGGAGTDAEGADADASVRGTAGPACDGDCRLRVENRLDVDVTVSTERQPGVEELGVVRSNRTAALPLPDFRGQELEVWVRDARTRELLHVTCVRRFPRETGQLVMGSELRGGGC